MKTNDKMRVFLSRELTLKIINIEELIELIAHIEGYIMEEMQKIMEMVQATTQEEALNDVLHGMMNNGNLKNNDALKAERDWIVKAKSAKWKRKRYEGGKYSADNRHIPICCVS